jgi:hypothetical protein
MEPGLSSRDAHLDRPTTEAVFQIAQITASDRPSCVNF